MLKKLFRSKLGETTPNKSSLIKSIFIPFAHVNNAIDIRLSFDILFESLNLGELIADGNFSFNNLVRELRSYILKEHYINELNN